eukprot:229861_1
MDPEFKVISNTTILMHKGRPQRYYLNSGTNIQVWQDGFKYQNGDLVAINPSVITNKYNFLNQDNLISSFDLWSMCIKTHVSSESNCPQPHELFEDVLLNIIPFIRQYLMQFIKGITVELCNIIINLCYKANTFWWNGCKMKSQYKVPCGNLCSISLGICRICQNKALLKDAGLQNNSVSKQFIQHRGSILKLNKQTGTWIRSVSNNEKNEIRDKNVVLMTDIVSENERDKIRNLLTRNFNESMKDLINCCLDNIEIFVYKNNNEKIQINIGKTNVWALYLNDKQLMELCCGLIWRSVRRRNKLLFEILFLSTSENIRFQYYGHEMAKRIECYCRENCYDLIAVAAVKGHGESFWSSNGFEMKHKQTNEMDLKGVKSWLQNNMLVFTDTPLFAKFLN